VSLRSRAARGAGCALAALCTVAVPLPACAAPDAETAAFFRTNCASCHTIGGGRLTGPDLRNVLERRDRAWLSQFIPNPKATIDRGDAYAKQLLVDARGVLMPALPGLTPDRVTKLLDLVEAESKLEKSAFAGSPVDDRPFTPEDVAQGRDLFVGTARLQNGGAPCISCHSIPGTPVLGGGALGPDLAKVFERLQGRAALTAWLQAPATPTMQAVFRRAPLDPAEVRPLVALFQDASLQPGTGDPAGARFSFAAFGLGGTGLLLLLFGFLWRKRFRAVRSPLVHETVTWGES
jgi:mono/diheme cytochrome c family protein